MILAALNLLPGRPVYCLPDTGTFDPVPWCKPAFVEGRCGHCKNHNNKRGPKPLFSRLEPYQGRPVKKGYPATPAALPSLIESHKAGVHSIIRWTRRSRPFSVNHIDHRRQVDAAADTWSDLFAT